jgi:hypothetical protein
MTSVTAYYDGLAFVPVEPVDLPTGTVIQLSVIKNNILENKRAEKAAAFRRLNKDFHELNSSEPLTDKFNQILAQRVSFPQEITL